MTRDGYAARAGHVDIMVAMNAETYSKDVREVASGGYLLYDATWPRSSLLQRGDITVIGVPLAQLVNENFDGVRNRILLKNIAYAGVMAALLDIDLEAINGLMTESYGKKPKLLESNTRALRLGYDYAKEHLQCPLPLRVERMDKTRGHIMIDGNTAAGLGCVYAGATVGAWYPITPSTSLMDAFKGFCERYRVDPATGEHNYAVIQAEDELAAIGMVLGASWNGARAFTPTSGPGISLMNEFLGLAYYAEIPCVIFDVQRVGPSTGMPTRTQQGDIMLCAYASHGDTRHVLLFPANPEECFYMAVKAFDLAERLQTPVFVLSDLDIGMNDWMCKDLKWDDAYQPDRGKMLSAEELASLDKFYRYVDRDDDAIPTVPCPASVPRGPISPAARGTTSMGPTRRIPPNTSRARPAEAQVLDRRALRAEARDRRQGRQQDRHRERRQLRRSGARGHRRARAAEDSRRLHAHQGVSLRSRRRELLELARDDIRGRAESRCAAALAPHPRDGGGQIQAQVHPELQRLSDVVRAHRRRCPRDSSRCAAADRDHRQANSLERNHVIHQQAQSRPSIPADQRARHDRRQYEGTMSTLCAGCGHDSVTAAIIEACWGLDMRPEQLVKLSGIGCSSKTTSYFVSGAHGFNSVHGRMPSIASGANAANRELTYVGVSGDGDSLSIGLGQLVHAIRRNVNMLYLIENNGVYGLTKGQFFASADVGTKAKRARSIESPPIDPVLLGLSLGATSVARGFSGDKASSCR